MFSTSLSSLTGLNNNPNVAFRLYGYNAGGTTGNGRLDNVAITGCQQISAPMISKSFSPGAVNVNASGASTLSFTITNPNLSQALNGVAFNDSLPSGLVVATPNGLSGNCGGGTITATAGSSTISLSGATMAENSSCAFSVNVTGTSYGRKNNTTSVTSTNGGTGNTTYDTLKVYSPPGISKAFSPATIPAGSYSTMTFTLTNPNPSDLLSGVGFSDTYPTNLINYTPLSTSNSCGGTLSALAGSNSISLLNGNLAANGTCTVTVYVTSTIASTYNNTSGAVYSIEGGTGGTASASLTVLIPPTISKAFAVSNIASGGNTSLTVTIGNSNASAITLTSVLTDTLPTGMTINTAGNSGTCTGVTPTAGAGSFTMARVLVDDDVVNGSGCCWQ